MIHSTCQYKLALHPPWCAIKAMMVTITPGPTHKGMVIRITVGSLIGILLQVQMICGDAHTDHVFPVSINVPL